MYANFDTKKKTIYLAVLASTIQDLITYVDNYRSTELSKVLSAGLQAALSVRLPGLVDACERSEQIWLKGMMDNSPEWTIIAHNDMLANENQLVNFLTAFTRDIERQLFMRGGSDRLQELLTAAKDIYEVHYLNVLNARSLVEMVHVIHKRLGQEASFNEIDPHHRSYISLSINATKSRTALRSALNNLLHFVNLETVEQRKLAQVQAGASKVGGSLKAQ